MSSERKSHQIAAPMVSKINAKLQMHLMKDGKRKKFTIKTNAVQSHRFKMAENSSKTHRNFSSFSTAVNIFRYNCWHRSFNVVLFILLEKRGSILMKDVRYECFVGDQYNVTCMHCGVKQCVDL